MAAAAAQGSSHRDPRRNAASGAGSPHRSPGSGMRAHGRNPSLSPDSQNVGFGTVHPQGRGRRCPAPGLGAAQQGCKQHLFPEQGVLGDESRHSWEGRFYGIDGESVTMWKMLITPCFLAPRPWHSLSACPVSWQVWHHFLAPTWVPGKRWGWFWPHPVPPGCGRGQGRRRRVEGGDMPSPAPPVAEGGKSVQDPAISHPGTLRRGSVVHPFGRPGN